MGLNLKPQLGENITVFYLHSSQYSATNVRHMSHQGFSLPLPDPLLMHGGGVSFSAVISVVEASPLALALVAKRMRHTGSPTRIHLGRRLSCIGYRKGLELLNYLIVANGIEA